MGYNSPINLGLPQSPRLDPNSPTPQQVHGEFSSVYMAVHNLWRALSDYIESGGGGGGGGAAAWGTITGTLSSQTDLWNLLGTKLTDAPNNANLYGRKGGTWQVIEAASSPSWGEITGTLANQTDLWNVLQGLDSDITSILDTLPLKLGDAPSDGKYYLRRNANWVEQPAYPSVSWGAISGSLAAQTDLAAALSAKLEDAPTDGKQYARKNGAWAEVVSGGGGGGSVVAVPVTAYGHARVSVSTAIVASSFPLLPVPFNSVVTDELNLWDSDNKCFVIPEGVTKVRLHGSAELVSTNTPYGAMHLSFRRLTASQGYVWSNAEQLQSSGASYAQDNSGYTGRRQHTISAIIDVQAGDKICLRINSNFSSSLNTFSEPVGNWFELEIIDAVRAPDPGPEPGPTTGGVLPLVTGIPPQLVYLEDGNLVYFEI